MYVHTLDELCQPNKMYMHMLDHEQRMCFLDMHDLPTTILVRLPPSYILGEDNKGIDNNGATTMRLCVRHSIAELFHIIEENAIAHVNQNHPNIQLSRSLDSPPLMNHVVHARIDVDREVLAFNPDNKPIPSTECNMAHLQKTFVEPILAIHGFSYDDDYKVTFDYELIQLRTCHLSVPSVDVRNVNLFLLKEQGN